MEESDVLEILQVLQESFVERGGGFYTEEIMYVGQILGWGTVPSYNECWGSVCSILREAKEEGKVIMTPDITWKLAPSAEAKE